MVGLHHHACVCSVGNNVAHVDSFHRSQTLLEAFCCIVPCAPFEYIQHIVNCGESLLPIILCVTGVVAQHVVSASDMKVTMEFAKLGMGAMAELGMSDQVLVVPGSCLRRCCSGVATTCTL